ncbi:MAG: hypothetical protein ACYDEQ_03450 [Desulfocucumaceae bacterium]
MVKNNFLLTILKTIIFLSLWESACGISLEDIRIKKSDYRNSVMRITIEENSEMSYRYDKKRENIILENFWVNSKDYYLAGYWQDPMKDRADIYFADTLYKIPSSCTYIIQYRCAVDMPACRIIYTAWTENKDSLKLLSFINHVGITFMGSEYLRTIQRIRNNTFLLVGYTDGGDGEDSWFGETWVGYLVLPDIFYKLYSISQESHRIDGLSKWSGNRVKYDFDTLSLFWKNEISFGTSTYDEKTNKTVFKRDSLRRSEIDLRKKIREIDSKHLVNVKGLIRCNDKGVSPYYYIITKSEKLYYPLNLVSQYEVDSLEIIFDGFIHTDLPHELGPGVKPPMSLLEILDLRVIDE